MDPDADPDLQHWLQGKRDVTLLRFEQTQQRLNETATTNWLKIGRREATVHKW